MVWFFRYWGRALARARRGTSACLVGMQPGRVVSAIAIILIGLLVHLETRGSQSFFGQADWYLSWLWGAIIWGAVVFAGFFLVAPHRMDRDQARQIEALRDAFGTEETRQEDAARYAERAEHGSSLLNKWANAYTQAERVAVSEEARTTWQDGVRLDLAKHYGDDIAEEFRGAEPAGTVVGTNERLEHAARVSALRSIMGRVRRGEIPRRIIGRSVS